MPYGSARRPCSRLRLTSARARSTRSFRPSACLSGLMRAGFVPVDARQTQARRASPAACAACRAAAPAIRDRAAQGLRARGGVPEQPRWHERLPAAGGHLPRGVHERPHRVAGRLSGRTACPIAETSSTRWSRARSIVRAVRGLAAQVERMEQRMTSRDEQIAVRRTGAERCGFRMWPRAACSRRSF